MSGAFGYLFNAEMGYISNMFSAKNYSGYCTNNGYFLDSGSQVSEDGRLITFNGKNIKSPVEFISDNAGIGLAVAGGFASGGTAWVIWGVGAVLDGYSVYQHDWNPTHGLSSIAGLPPFKKTGAITATVISTYNTYFRDNNVKK
jgi:hypothetical protein